MTQTVLELIQEAYPDALKVWDRYDYRITAPLSLDDVATVNVSLTNKNVTQATLSIPMQLVGRYQVTGPLGSVTMLDEARIKRGGGE